MVPRDSTLRIVNSYIWHVKVFYLLTYFTYLLRHNLFAGTETLSLSVYKPIAIKILIGDLTPIWGKGDVRGSSMPSVVPHESPSQWA